MVYVLGDATERGRGNGKVGVAHTLKKRFHPVSLLVQGIHPNGLTELVVLHRAVLPARHTRVRL